MRYQPITCEANVHIYDKVDCAYHAVLGWSQTEWHSHRKGQLIYGEHGIIRVYTSETIYYIPSGHVLWIPAFVEHKVVTESVNLTFHTLYLDCSNLANDYYRNIHLFYADVMLREMILYTAAFDLTTTATEHERSFLESIKYMLPNYTARAVNLEIPFTEDPRLLEITDFIEKEIEQLPGADEVAGKFNMSSRSMLRLFQKELKISYSNYVKQVRIIKAVEMLMKPGIRVSEVAYAVGYESLPTFSNNFFEIMGVRPNLFLK